MVLVSCLAVMSFPIVIMAITELYEERNSKALKDLQAQYEILALEHEELKQKVLRDGK